MVDSGTNRSDVQIRTWGNSFGSGVDGACARNLAPVVVGMGETPEFVTTLGMDIVIWDQLTCPALYPKINLHQRGEHTVFLDD